MVGGDRDPPNSQTTAPALFHGPLAALSSGQNPPLQLSTRLHKNICLFFRRQVAGRPRATSVRRQTPLEATNSSALRSPGTHLVDDGQNHDGGGNRKHIPKPASDIASHPVGIIAQDHLKDNQAVGEGAATSKASRQGCDQGEVLGKDRPYPTRWSFLNVFTFLPPIFFTNQSG